MPQKQASASHFLPLCHKNRQATSRKRYVWQNGSIQKPFGTHFVLYIAEAANYPPGNLNNKEYKIIELWEKLLVLT